MKTIWSRKIAGVLILLASLAQSFAVVDQAIQVQGTNLVLSWPSLGYESYMIQYRQTLSASTPWTQLTNAYPANSTNRTTFVITAAVLGGAGSFSLASMPDSFSLSSSAMEAPVPESSELLAMPADGSGDPVPLALYPEDFDKSNLIILTRADLASLSVAQAQDISPTDPFPTDPPSDDETLDNGTANPNGISSDLPRTGFFRVWHIPDFPASITNYLFDGPLFIPVDFKDYQDRVENIQVLIDGQPTLWADYMSLTNGSGQTNWGMGIYFDRFTNGTHQIQLVTTLHINDDIDQDAVYLVLSNRTRTITVANQVAYPDWNDFIQGDTYTLNAQPANPNSDWWIDIYDVWGNYVNTGSGHTSNGQISWTWNLLDYMGYSRDDFDSDPYFYPYITFNTGSAMAGVSGAQSQTTRPMPVSVKGYPNTGQWLIAYQDRWYIDAPGYSPDLQTSYDSAIDAVCGGPALKGDPLQRYPIKFGTNVYTQAEREYCWTNLIPWIGDLYVRNFYYHGHGGGTSLGADRHTLGTNGLVTGSALTSRNSKSQIFSWQVASQTRANRYRFVFLDGCSTSTGDWPNAFNISKTQRDITFYQNDPKHPRPSVFVGWNQEIGGPGWGTANNRLNFQAYWMGNWAVSFPPSNIHDALDLANTGAGWISSGQLWGALQIYGYPAMTMEAYNHKGDWRWP